MDIKERYNEPGVFVASKFSAVERHTLQYAFTEAVNLNAAEILENSEDEEADLDSIDEKFIELSLIEEDDAVTLTADQIDSVRRTLIEFATSTAETVRAKLKETDPHDLYKADGIPFRMRIGRCARRMQQDFAAHNNSNRTAEEESGAEDTKNVDQFLASIPELAAQDKN